MKPMTPAIEDLKALLETVESAPMTVLTEKEADNVLLSELRDDLKLDVKVVGPAGPSHSLLILELGGGSSLWLSDYGNLATIMDEAQVPPHIRSKVDRVLAKNGRKYVPEVLANSPIHPGGEFTWHMELFGYY